MRKTIKDDANLWKSNRSLPRRREGLNLHIARLVEESGLTDRQLARLSGLSTSQISSFLHGKANPINDAREWTPSARRFAYGLGYSPEEVFPEEVWKELKQTAELNFTQLLYERTAKRTLTDICVDRNERHSDFLRWLSTIRKNERNALVLFYGASRFGYIDDRDLAKMYGVSRGRLGQIIAKNARRLKHPTRIRLVWDHLNTDINVPCNAAADIFRPSPTVPPHKLVEE